MCYWCNQEYKRASVEHVISFLSSGAVCLYVLVWQNIEKMSERCFKRCVPPCEIYITPSDSHELCVVCLGTQHVRLTLEGADCLHCDRFMVKQLLSHMALFTEDGSQASAPRGAELAAADAERHLHSWGSQLDLANQLGAGFSPYPNPRSPALLLSNLIWKPGPQFLPIRQRACYSAGLALRR